MSCAASWSPLHKSRDLDVVVDRRLREGPNGVVTRREEPPARLGGMCRALPQTPQGERGRRRPPQGDAPVPRRGDARPRGAAGSGAGAIASVRRHRAGGTTPAGGRQRVPQVAIMQCAIRRGDTGPACRPQRAGSVCADLPRQVIRALRSLRMWCWRRATCPAGSAQWQRRDGWPRRRRRAGRPACPGRRPAGVGRGIRAAGGCRSFASTAARGRRSA